MTTTESERNQAAEKAGIDTDEVGENLGHLTQERTIELLLARSKRANRTVPIRRDFLQTGKTPNTQPGVMRSLVASRQERALDLYLLMAAVTGAGDYSVTDWSSTWARTVGIFDEKSGASAVSRAWKGLRELNVISTARGAGRRTTVTKLLEDGSGPYHPPVANEAYFQLPFEYWEQNLHTTLSLPGKAVYLISLAQRKPKFSLAQAKVGEWYGLAERTVAKGIKDLIHHEVLERVGSQVYETLAVPSGRASRPLYALKDPFGHRGLPVSTPRDSSEEQSQEG
ncbi:hypothetical protein [Streptomyces sp. NPDC046887]|uniref:hypothetical protein n=1 Tax=Streptomyces sp. NPDC046887 TaxID=3155472 RepID=UPI0033C79574